MTKPSINSDMTHGSNPSLIFENYNQSNLDSSQYSESNPVLNHNLSQLPSPQGSGDVDHLCSESSTNANVFIGSKLATIDENRASRASATNAASRGINIFMAPCGTKIDTRQKESNFFYYYSLIILFSFSFPSFYPSADRDTCKPKLEEYIPQQTNQVQLYSVSNSVSLYLVYVTSRAGQ